VKLKATKFSAADNGEFLDFGFYDHHRTYGFGFTRSHGDNRIELMIADQSVYDLVEAKITFQFDRFEIELPKGTIRTEDGEDQYLITYKELSRERYNEALDLLRAILEVNPNVLLQHS
jgi:hypothetical protein